MMRACWPNLDLGRTKVGLVETSGECWMVSWMASGLLMDLVARLMEWLNGVVEWSEVVDHVGISSSKGCLVSMFTFVGRCICEYESSIIIDIDWW